MITTNRLTGRCRYRYLLFSSLLSAFVSVFLLFTTEAHSAQAHLTWSAPTTSADGTSLEDLAGYKIYYGVAAGIYSMTVNVGDVNSYTVDNLTEGNVYYFAVKAYDTSGNESFYSNELSKTIPLPQYTLSIVKTGGGTGTITSSPAGITCGPDCAEPYYAGATVTLTAMPGADSVFSGWTGLCFGNGTCTIAMDSEKSVTASFAVRTFTITAIAGEGGTISPSGSTSVLYGTNQTYTITPATGYEISDVLVDNLSTGVISTYAFISITGDHAISASFAALPGTAKIPATGQTLSYAGGDDGFFRAGIAWSDERFVDNGDGTITDALSGLMWLKDGGCLRSTWKNAMSTVAAFNSGSAKYSCANYAQKYSDWRFPNIREIESLVSYGKANISAWLISEGFVNIKTSPYWASTTYQSSTVNAWFINMQNGAQNAASKKLTYYLLPVRSSSQGNKYEIPRTGQTTSYTAGDDGSVRQGLQWPSPRYTDNGDGTITDGLTGLMWLKDGGCLRDKWNQALAEIAGFNTNSSGYNCLSYTARYSDWRLPNVREMDSLVNFGAANSSLWLNSSGFLNTQSSNYWTSTTGAGDTSSAWIINLSRGNISSLRKNDYTNYVLPVRGGNPSLPQ